MSWFGQLMCMIEILFDSMGSNNWSSAGKGDAGFSCGTLVGCLQAYTLLVAELSVF